MTHNLYLVFSKPPAGVSSDEFHEWYADHAQENIESPRFVSAQRYEVRRIVAGAEDPSHEHLAAYEYAGTYDEWRDHLSGRLKSGAIVLPEWFPEIPFESFDCRPVGNRLTPQGR
jgi:hypothetical protein